MIFWVEDHIFSTGASHEVDRVALLRNAATRRHTLWISTSPDTPLGDRPRFDAWRDTLHPALQAEVDHLTQRARRVSANATTRGAERVHVLAAPTPQGPVWEIGLHQAVRVAGLPLHVLVENAVNDATFLRRVMPPPWRTRLREWEDDGLLRFEHGGGLPGMQNLADAFGEQPEWRLTRTVIYDHDGQKPKNPSRDALALKETLRACGMKRRSHMLQRKKQESYLPDEALDALLRHRFDPSDRPTYNKTLGALNKYRKKDDDTRRFEEPRPPNAFKNGFTEDLDWQDTWFQRDGSWPEMRAIAEMIAAAM